MKNFKQERYGFGPSIDTLEVEDGVISVNLEDSCNYISVQTIPGVTLNINSGVENTKKNILIGSSGVLEIDFSNTSNFFPNFNIDSASIALIDADGGYLIINLGFKS